ncbi:single-stranded DNA-binding protein [Cupriavidus pauculus]|uniref:single-stranded DNA-binding protein n=1 Tax=Cupriavidus pauculus TaxID=82633 RepID=UPI003857CA10
MSEAAAKVQPLAKQKPRQVLIEGKVLRVRRHEQFFYTTVICPAEDAYSRPQVVELRSKARFADKEEETSVMGMLGGYEGKAYTVTDRETGERRALIPVNLFLDVIEG